MKKAANITKNKSKKPSFAVMQTSSDLKNALLIVSLLGNLFVLCVWIVVRLTSDYDQALLQFFFNK